MKARGRWEEKVERTYDGGHQGQQVAEALPCVMCYIYFGWQ